jgi:hypothetical protein
MAGILLLLVGVALLGWGARSAASGKRPLDLVGAVAAPVGVALCLVGALALAVPHFLR